MMGRFGIWEIIIILIILGIIATAIFLVYFIIKKATKKGRIEAQKEIEQMNADNTTKNDDSTTS